MPEDKKPKKRGRPTKVDYDDLPEPIDASMEEAAQTVLQAKPKKDWRYLREHGLS